MTENPSSEDNVSLTLKADELELSAQLPAHLPQDLLKGFAKAARFVFAGSFPRWFKRADIAITQAELRKILLDSLDKNSGDRRQVEMLVGLLVPMLEEQKREIQSRALLLQRSGQLLEEMNWDPKERRTPEIEDDFLGAFWRITDTISDQRMREVFANVLAREIRSPRSFSASTLNLLSTLHPVLAEKFRIVCSMTFLFRGSAFVPISMPDSRSLGKSEKKGEQLMEFGISSEDLLDLRSGGLIRSLPEEEYPDLTDFLAATTVEFAGSNAGFDVTSDVTQAALSRGRINVVSLTRSGMELRPILELRPHTQYAGALSMLLESTGIMFRYGA